MDGFARLYSGDIQDRLDVPAWLGGHGPSLASRPTSLSRSERGPVGIAGPRMSPCAALGVKKELPESDKGGLDRKLEPKDARGPDGTLGGIDLSGVWASGGFGSGFCSIFFGKSSVGDVLEATRGGCNGGSGLGES